MLCLAAACAGMAPAAMAQKKVTPVETDDHRTERPQLHYFDRHGNPLAEPVLFLSDLDTVTGVKSGPVYPLLNAVSVGVDFFDAVMLLAGQTHSSFSASARLSLHNWFFPTIEVGLGSANRHVEGDNYRYKGKLSPFFRLGADYNFLYKSNPDYQVFVGLRLGFSRFGYSVNDITVNSPYWDESEMFSITGQRASVLWGEALAGLKVKIAGPISMGWTFRYHGRFHTSTHSSAYPWFVPGYGGSARIGATFSIFYTLPLSRKRALDENPALSDD